jgi:hypothetical protein
MMKINLTLNIFRETIFRQIQEGGSRHFLVTLLTHLTYPTQLEYLRAPL